MWRKQAPREILMQSRIRSGSYGLYVTIVLMIPKALETLLSVDDQSSDKYQVFLLIIQADKR
jgi:hypothetical protein